MHNFFKKLIAMSMGVLFALILLELACQAYFALVVKKTLEAQRNDPLHYYKVSEDPILQYELKPGYQLEKEGKRIAINEFGFRDDGDHADAPKKVALLGDSVPFGIALSQEETPAANLQTLLGDSIKVINFGTPGYGLEEIARYFESKYPVYKPEKVYYVLNLNDFSRRNTIYEGADNGLYRIYCRPGIKMPFFIKKAIYRFIKEGKMSSVPWYRWMYEGNKEKGLADIRQMADFAKLQGSSFSVVLFPPAVAYENGQFVLQDVFDEITARLKKEGIPVYDPVEIFQTNTAELIDGTDHFTAKGSKVMAGYLGGIGELGN